MKLRNCLILAFLIGATPMCFAGESFALVATISSQSQVMVLALAQALIILRHLHHHLLQDQCGAHHLLDILDMDHGHVDHVTHITIIRIGNLVRID